MKGSFVSNLGHKNEVRCSLPVEDSPNGVGLPRSRLSISEHRTDSSLQAELDEGRGQSLVDLVVGVFRTEGEIYLVGRLDRLRPSPHVQPRLHRVHLENRYYDEVQGKFGQYEGYGKNSFD